MNIPHSLRIEPHEALKRDFNGDRMTERDLWSGTIAAFLITFAFAAVVLILAPK